jgi:plastocyanin
MKRKALMFTGLCALAAVLAQAGLRPASAHATHSLAKTIIRVETHNSIFKMSAKTAPRGIVIFKVTNTASFRHDFSIKGRTTRVLSTGQSTTLRVTFLRPGRYPYRCTLRSHAGWGQKGVFTIT